MTLRVFLYEYTCARGSDELNLSPSLKDEGQAMLLAVLEDFGRIPGVEPVTLVTRGLGFPLFRGADRIRTLAPGANEQAAFRQLARSAAFTLVIAPEVDQLLWTRCRWVEDSGGRLLGPSSTGVALTGDKLALAEFLRRAGIPTPACRLVLPGETTCPLPFPVVCKPRQGAGSIATFLIGSATAWPDSLERGQAEGWAGQYLVQRFVPGQAASVAFLVGPGLPIALPPATQELSTDGRFRYRGGQLPLPPALAERAVTLAARAVAAVPGLRGYVGVDVVLGDAADGSRDWVIEINPRLTTSYVGLRALARTNLAEALLWTVTGTDWPDLQWSAGPVHFRADGTVEAAA